MINKNMFVKLGLFAFAVLGLSLSFTSAIGLVFRNDINVDFGNMETVAISFKDNGNDFGGAMIFFKGGNSITGEVEIELPDGVISRYECERQLKGFYYNAERGDRLRPLDSDIMEKVKAEGFSTGADAPIGALYTNCRRTILDDGKTYDQALTDCDSKETEEEKVVCREEVEENYALGNYYYGMITRKYQGIESHLVAGTDYKLDTPWIVIDDDKGFGDTLVSIQTSAPVGFVYDDNGGVGFMHCNPESWILERILNLINNQHKKLGDLFKLSGDLLVWDEEAGGTEITQADIYCGAPGSLAGSLLGVVIEGLVGKTSDRFGISAAEDPKMQYFSSVSVNNATLLNFTKKKAESLCRGRWGTNTTGTVVCLSGAGRGEAGVDASSYRGQTLIVKDGDVIVSPATSYNDKYYDIFVENGDLLIREDSPVPEKFVFKKDGFIKEGMDASGFNNLILNNLSGGCRLSMWAGEEAAVASLLKGNFIVDGHVKGLNSDAIKNKYFIHGKFTSRDSYDDLLGTFEWRCGSNGMEVNGHNYCPSCNGKITTECWDGEDHFPVEEECPYTNYYTNSPLVVIDQKFDSPLFR